MVRFGTQSEGGSRRSCWCTGHVRGRGVGAGGAWHCFASPEVEKSGT